MIQEQIAEVESMLGGKAIPSTEVSENGTGKRRKFSAASRRKMALAQRKRWAALKGSSSEGPGTRAPEAPKKAKRKMSVSVRKAIGEATRKRWALRRAAESTKSAPMKNPSRKVAASTAKKTAPKKSAPVVAAAV